MPCFCLANIETSLRLFYPRFAISDIGSVLEICQAGMYQSVLMYRHMVYQVSVFRRERNRGRRGRDGGGRRKKEEAVEEDEGGGRGDETYQRSD